MGRYGEVWARRNVYSAPHGYYKCTATHGTLREAHAGPRGVVQQIPEGVYNTQGVSTLTPHICSLCHSPDSAEWYYASYMHMGQKT